jgi:hypothetical protein
MGSLDCCLCNHYLRRNCYHKEKMQHFPLCPGNVPWTLCVRAIDVLAVRSQREAGYART